MEIFLIITIVVVFIVFIIKMQEKDSTTEQMRQIRAKEIEWVQKNNQMAAQRKKAEEDVQEMQQSGMISKLAERYQMRCYSGLGPNGLSSYAVAKRVAESLPLSDGINENNKYLVAYAICDELINAGVIIEKTSNSGLYETVIQRGKGQYVADQSESESAKTTKSLTGVLPDINTVDTMDGHRFEQYCASLLRQIGFINVEVTKGSGDQGVDIVAVKDGIRYAVQCKCYSSDLGNTPVQEVNAGKTLYKCHVGVVLTNRYFTAGAKELAEATGVLLWDRDELMRIIAKAEKL